MRVPKDHTNIIIIAQELSEESALNIERVQIAMWGRINIQTGILRNKTDGGVSSTGWNHTPEMRAHFSNIRKGKSAHNKGKTASTQSRANMKLAAINREAPTESTKQKIRETLTGRSRPLEVCLKISNSKKGIATSKGKTRSVEFKQIMGDIVRGSHYWNNGLDMKRSVECPGPGYVLGRLNQNVRYWNNGQIMKKSAQSPGEGWQLGKLKTGALWWNNGQIMKKSVESPGAEWQLGRINKHAHPPK